MNNSAVVIKDGNFNKAKKKKATPGKIIGRVVFYLVLVAFAFFQIMPFWLKIVESLQPSHYHAIASKIYWLPISATWSNYIVAWKEAKLFEGYINSIIVTGLYTLLSSAVALLVGYVLAKKRFRGKTVVFLLLLSTMMIPGEITMISNFELINSVLYFMLDDLSALIIPGMVNIFGVFLIKQFLESLPDSLFESAKLDGANELQLMWFLVLPLVLPAIATYVILTVISIWNDYLFPNLILTSSEHFTVQLKLMYFNGTTGTSRDQIMKAAGMILVTFPIVAVYCIFQKKFVEGIAITGLK